MSGAPPNPQQVDDPALDEALAAFDFRQLHQDGMLATFRGQHASEPRTILMTTSAAGAVATEAALYLNNEYSLRERLAPAWSRKPFASIWRHGTVALLYDDVAGEPLDLRPARAVGVDAFLSLAIGITSAVRSLHEAGLLHQNIKPANILVDLCGTCRLAGFGIASVAAPSAGIQGPALPWVIRGTPAYMSPEHTGRTKFAVDARSDLYSLGVTLFELLTGRLPFEVADTTLASEWIHAHLASEPGAPHRIAPGVPPMLSQLVLKLLAKTPDERYQSAAGLEADLKRCRLAWRTSARIAPFQLALRDSAATLVFPDRLYGRDAAMASLISAYQHVRACGTPTLAIVSGPSGVGKSSLLNAMLAEPPFLRASITLAKADQFGGTVPYVALAAALRRLVLGILGQSEQEVNDWRQRVLQGLGTDSELAFSLVPELELLAGPRAGPASGTAPEVESRLTMVVYGLLRIFAIRERPLVLIVDDVQWLDPATLHLLENLTGVAADLPFMLVLSCRSAETAGEQAPGDRLAVLRARAAHAVDVELAVLDLASLEQLLAETLSSGSRQVAGLAALIHQKTAGNPYFVKQFIKTIVDDGLIARPPGGGNGISSSIRSARAATPRTLPT